MKIFIFIFIFSTLLIAGENVQTVVENLQKKYQSIRDVSVTFSQNVKFGVTKNEQTFQGKLMMKKGNKYRIELEEQTIVTDGITVWSFSKLNKQIIIDKFKDDPKSFSPDKILINVPKNYNATLIGKEKIKESESSIIKLIPKDEKVNLKWMKVWVDDDEYIMKKIQILDISDNLITYTIEEIKINNDLPDKYFKLEIPQNVEVIDLR